MIDKLKAIYQRDRMLVITPAFAIILFLVIIPFIIIPQVQLLSVVRNDIAKGKERLAHLEDKNAKLEQADVADLQQQFALSSAALPSTKDIGSLLVAIDILSQKHGVTLSDFSTSLGILDEAPALGAGAPSPSLVIAVAIGGNLENIKAFLEAISASLPIVSVSNVSFSKNGAAISLVFYYKPIVTSLPPVDSDLPDLTRYKETIATLSARRALTGSQPLTIPNFEDQSAPAKPQIFNRPDPFF
jgi:Tfp pilus assembly protein PilO